MANFKFFLLLLVALVCWGYFLKNGNINIFGGGDVGLFFFLGFLLSLPLGAIIGKIYRVKYVDNGSKLGSLFYIFAGIIVGSGLYIAPFIISKIKTHISIENNIQRNDELTKQLDIVREKFMTMRPGEIRQTIGTSFPKLQALFHDEFSKVRPRAYISEEWICQEMGSALQRFGDPLTPDDVSAIDEFFSSMNKKDVGAETVVYLTTCAELRGIAFWHEGFLSVDPAAAISRCDVSRDACIAGYLQEMNNYCHSHREQCLKSWDTSAQNRLRNALVDQEANSRARYAFDQLSEYIIKTK